MTNIQNLIEENLPDNTVVAVNISYFSDSTDETSKKESGKYHSKSTYYDYFVTNIPNNILKFKNDPDVYFDILESYVYNRISSLSRRPVVHCQIYIND